MYERKEKIHIFRDITYFRQNNFYNTMIELQLTYVVRQKHTNVNIVFQAWIIKK